jgi:hypothetical protein
MGWLDRCGEIAFGDGIVIKIFWQEGASHAKT